MKIKRYIEKNFFGIYFFSVILIFIGQIFFCGTVSFSSCVFGDYEEEKQELLDGHTIELAFRVVGDSPKGFLIYDFQDNGIEFSDEKICLSIWQEDTGELLQYNEIKPSDITENIYVLFEQEIKKGTQLKVKIWTEGFGDKGPLLALSDTCDYSSSLWCDRVLSSKYLCSALCYRKKTYDYLKPMLYLLAEILAGCVLLRIRKRFSISVFPLKEQMNGKQELHDKCWRVFQKSIKIAGLSKKMWIKAVGGVGAILIVTGFFFDYVYTYTVEPEMYLRSYEMVCSGKTENESELLLSENDKMEQVISVEEDYFSGVGLQIVSGSDSDGTLGIRLYDYNTGKLLLEKKYRISSLPKLSELLKESVSEAENEDYYVGVDFQKVITVTSNQYFRLELYVEDMQGDVLVLGIAPGDNFPLKRNNETVANNLCMVTLHSSAVFLSGLFCGMFCIVVSLLSFLYVQLLVHKVSVWRIYAVSALAFGVIYLFLIPPYCVPDERTHFDSAYKISNELMGITDVPGPSRIYKRACDIQTSREQTEYVTTDRYGELYCALFEEHWNVSEEEEVLVVAYADSAVENVTVFNYLPSAVGFTIARLLHWGHIPMLLLGRCFNMLTVIFMICVAIKRIPFGKSVLAVTGLLPMCLQEMASCSYDGIIIGGAFIFIASSMHVIYEKEQCLMDIILMLISGFFLAACKGGVYLPILGLIVIVPVAAKKINRQTVAATIVFLFSMLLVFCAQFSSRVLPMLLQAQGTSFRSGNLEMYTLSYLLQRPKEFIRLFQNTFVVMGDHYLGGAVGSSLGKLNIGIPWYMILAFLFLLVLCATKRPKEKAYFNIYSRSYIFLLCLGSTLLIMLSMLIAWTEFGSERIDGVQGRYFLPFISLLFLLLRNDKLSFQGKRSDVLVWLAAVLNMFAVGMILLSIY